MVNASVYFGGGVGSAGGAKPEGIPAAGPVVSGAYYNLILPKAAAIQSNDKALASTERSDVWPLFWPGGVCDAIVITMGTGGGFIEGSLFVGQAHKLGAKVFDLAPVNAPGLAQAVILVTPTSLAPGWYYLALSKVEGETAPTVVTYRGGQEGEDFGDTSVFMQLGSVPPDTLELSVANRVISKYASDCAEGDEFVTLTNTTDNWLLAFMRAA